MISQPARSVHRQGHVPNQLLRSTRRGEAVERAGDSEQRSLKAAEDVLNPALRQLMFSKDKTGHELLSRLSRASRFHPLLLDRLARLVAGGAELRPQLEEALQALESSKAYARLPELFAARPAKGAPWRTKPPAAHVGSRIVRALVRSEAAQKSTNAHAPVFKAA